MHHILTTKVQLIVLQVNIDHIGHGGPYKGRDMETVLDWLRLTSEPLVKLLQD